MIAQTEHRAREAAEFVARGALLLDVRTPEEFALKHLPGAVNVPVQELVSRVTRLWPKPCQFVVYCRSGVRSAAAAAVLRGAGHQVFDLGAMENWQTP
jgi:phage shock protein E